MIETVLLAALYLALKAALRRREKDCPECGERVARKAKRCRFCGHAFPGDVRRTNDPKVVPIRRR